LAPIRVLHLIDGLDVNGVKQVLCTLLAAQSASRDRVTHTVLALSSRGPMGAVIESTGTPLGIVNPHRQRGGPGTWRRALGLLRRSDADILQSWETRANLLTAPARRRNGPQIVWGIHNLLRPADAPKRATRWAMRLARSLSHIPAAIVCCSEAVRSVYQELGYPAAKLKVVENGVDTGRCRPDEQARREVRAELSIPPDADVVGMVGNYAPVKDFPCFLEAASQIARRRPDVHFVLAGKDVAAPNAELSEAIDRLELCGRAHLLGLRDDLPRVYNAFDVLACTSHNEAFGLVVLEALSSGIPCVATDVGDLRRVVGDCGRIVPVGDAGAAAAALLETLDKTHEQRCRISLAARRRAEEHYSAARMAEGYERIYRQLVQPG